MLNKLKHKDRYYSRNNEGVDMVGEDVMTSFMTSFTQYGNFLILFGVLVALLVIFYIIVDRMYPKVEFDVIEGRRKTKLTRRLVGDKVVKDSLLEILLRGNQLLGFKISEYDYYYDGNIKVYFATRRGEDLIPFRINQESVDIAELGLGREIAMRYINAIDSVKGDLDKQNPLVLALISVLPIAILVLLTGVMFYLILNDAMPKLLDFNKQVMAQTVQVAQSTQETSQNMVLVATKLQLNTPTNTTNSTIYVTK